MFVTWTYPMLKFVYIFHALNNSFGFISICHCHCFCFCFIYEWEIYVSSFSFFTILFYLFVCISKRSNSVTCRLTITIHFFFNILSHLLFDAIFYCKNYFYGFFLCVCVCLWVSVLFYCFYSFALKRNLSIVWIFNRFSCFTVLFACGLRKECWRKIYFALLCFIETYIFHIFFGCHLSVGVHNEWSWYNFRK